MARIQWLPDPSSVKWGRARLAAGAAVLIAAGCSAPVLAPPDVPTPLRAPAGQELFLEVLASGVQIYACAAKGNQPTAFDWAFRAPEAALVDRSGRAIGKHYAGPTWESVDGSTVVGDVKARDPGPDPSAIPWLLLTAKSSTGTGVFTQTKSIQRLKTVGGAAPSQACGATNVGEVARVPYTATYYFYRVAP
jgi:FtsP/CotA-like multicopper oxidase with cupredoxin domain